ncbi:MAG: hypothetical protein ACOC1L_03525 [Bacillota bacterium]
MKQYTFIIFGLIYLLFTSSETLLLSGLVFVFIYGILTIVGAILLLKHRSIEAIILFSVSLLILVYTFIDWQLSNNILYERNAIHVSLASF